MNASAARFCAGLLILATPSFAADTKDDGRLGVEGKKGAVADPNVSVKDHQGNVTRIKRSFWVR
jgi:hypothetical protein